MAFEQVATEKVCAIPEGNQDRIRQEIESICRNLLSLPIARRGQFMIPDEHLTHLMGNRFVKDHNLFNEREKPPQSDESNGHDS